MHTCKSYCAAALMSGWNNWFFVTRAKGYKCAAGTETNAVYLLAHRCRVSSKIRDACMARKLCSQDEASISAWRYTYVVCGQHRSIHLSNSARIAGLCNE